MAEHLSSALVPLRTGDGAVRSMDEVDRDIIECVDSAIVSGRRVLLHVMDHSKLGWHCPSLECVRAISTRRPDSVQVVIDACQMRISRGTLRHYLDEGYVVQATGSKFFTGPPFSGALFVPAPLAARMTEVKAVPAGLYAYCGPQDWPAQWPRQEVLWRQSEPGPIPERSPRRKKYARTSLSCALPPVSARGITSIVPRLIEGHRNLTLLPTVRVVEQCL
jgi:hypothetical protein